MQLGWRRYGWPHPLYKVLQHFLPIPGGNNCNRQPPEPEAQGLLFLIFFHGDIYPVGVASVHAIGDRADAIMGNPQHGPEGYEVRGTPLRSGIQGRTDIFAVGGLAGITPVLIRVSDIVSGHLTQLRTTGQREMTAWSLIGVQAVVPGFDFCRIIFARQTARLPGQAAMLPDSGRGRYYRICIGIIGGQVGNAKNQPKGNYMCGY